MLESYTKNTHIDKSSWDICQFIFNTETMQSTQCTFPNMWLTQNTEQMCPHEQMGWREALPEKQWGKLFHSQPSDSKEPKDKGICCQLMAAHRCVWPGHAPTCTAKGYPVYCANMLIYLQGKHSWTQEPQEKQWNHIKTRGHAKHLRTTKKGEKSGILCFSFPKIKRIQTETF